MVDILGGMSSGSPTSSFLAFKAADKRFYVGEEALDVKYIQLDPATFQSGWGRYNIGTGYEFVWDDKFTVVGDKPADDYKRAFSAWLYTDAVDRPLLWQRFSYSESSAFNKMLGKFWNSQEAKEGLPIFEFKGATDIQVGKGRSADIEIDFLGYKPRNNNFIIPEWASNTDVGVQETESKGLTSDDIPF